MDVGRAKLPVPGGGQGPTVPGDLAQLALAVDKHLPLHVADVAERDELHADAPLHTLVSAENGTLWIKTSAATNSWATIYEPLPAWQPVTPATGYQLGSPPAEYLVEGERINLAGRIEPIAEGALIPTNGVAVGSVPQAIAPASQATVLCSSSLAGDIIVGTGRVEIVGLDNPSSSWGPPGTIVWWSQEGTAGGTPWINLSGSYWRNK